MNQELVNQELVNQELVNQELVNQELANQELANQELAWSVSGAWTQRSQAISGIDNDDINIELESDLSIDEMEFEQTFSHNIKEKLQQPMVIADRDFALIVNLKKQRKQKCYRDAAHIIPDIS